MKTQFNISVSLVKAFRDIQFGEQCGLQFRDVYINKLYSRPVGDAARLGQYFEYLCTGATLRDGVIPVPDRTQKGEPTAAYKQIEKQAENWKRFEKYYMITDKETSVEWVYDFNGISVKGIIDLRCKIGRCFFTNEVLVEPKVVNIDIKSTGLLDNPWEKYGWGVCVAKPETQAKFYDRICSLLMQAPAYTWLEKKLFGTESEFYFYVAANNNPDKRKLIMAECSEKSMEDWEKSVTYVAEMVQYHEDAGWTATDDFTHCIDCPAANPEKGSKIKKCINFLPHPRVIKIKL